MLLWYPSLFTIISLNCEIKLWTWNYDYESEDSNKGQIDQTQTDIYALKVHMILWKTCTKFSLLTQFISKQERFADV